jgi:adenylyltransferase/sulfurtransferase
LLLYDALGMRFRELKLRPNPECPVCGDHRTITKLIDYHQFCGVPNPLSAAPAQETKLNEGEISVTELKQKLDRGDDFVLIDVREPHEYQICAIPGAKLIPLGEFPKHVEEFAADADIVIHASRAAAARGPADSCGRMDFKKCATWWAAFWRGATRWTRASRSTEAGRGL